MEEKSNLFKKVILRLHQEGALESLVLIGSWTQYYYRDIFNNDPEVPAIKTMDVDFLIPNPPRIKKEVNVPKILEELEFTPIISRIHEHEKFDHPELAIEFLIPDLGRGKDEPYIIKKLHLKASGIRYLNLLQHHIIQVEKEGIKIKIPDPAAYVLQKLIIAGKRTNPEKREKDLDAAASIGNLIPKDPEKRKKLLDIYNALPKKWKKKIMLQLGQIEHPLRRIIEKTNE